MEFLADAEIHGKTKQYDGMMEKVGIEKALEEEIEGVGQEVEKCE